MKNSKPIVIIVLMVILLFLIILNLVLNKKPSLEHFQTTQQVSDDNSVDTFKKTHEFVEYSNNSEKLIDMFSSLEKAEEKCDLLESQQIQREEKYMMRENDKVHKELQEQDKKINELKDIVKYLTVEKKRRDNINKKCMNNKQRKLNDNYNIVKTLTDDGFLRDNTVDLDLNISDSDKLKNFLSSINNGGQVNSGTDSKIQKCNSVSSDDIDLSEIGDKCYGCNADKLKENENNIRQDFK